MRELIRMQFLADFRSVPVYIGQKLPHYHAIIVMLFPLSLDFREFDLYKGLDLSKGVCLREGCLVFSSADKRWRRNFLGKGYLKLTGTEVKDQFLDIVDFLCQLLIGFVLIVITLTHRKGLLGFKSKLAVSYHGF
jgi:hypothetical protein